MQHQFLIINKHMFFYIKKQYKKLQGKMYTAK